MQQIVSHMSLLAPEILPLNAARFVQFTPSLPDCSLALACSSSGLVLSGLKAASSTAAAASSDPDLLYSFGSGLRLSLSWASLRASWRGEMWKGRVAMICLLVRVVGCMVRDLRSVEVNMVAVIMWECIAARIEEVLGKL